MQQTLIRIAFLLMLGNSTLVMAEKAKDTNCTPRVPVIEYASAIDIAMKTAGTNATKIFLEGANLICEKNIHYWIITFRKREAETGRMMIKVYMDSKTDVSFSKDG